jgi:hypothetical protein
MYVLVLAQSTKVSGCAYVDGILVVNFTQPVLNGEEVHCRSCCKDVQLMSDVTVDTDHPDGRLPVWQLQRCSSSEKL